MSEQKKGKKRSKAYYRKCAAGSKKAKVSYNIVPGMKGFLVTCNKYDRETVREMYNLLAEYADVMYGPELDLTNVKGADNNGSDSDEEEDDMEKAMAKETTTIKKISSEGRRFQKKDSKCKNVIFIETTVEDPCRLAHEIFRDIQEKQVKKVRYAIRMLPVSVVCASENNEIEKALKKVLAPHFKTDFGEGRKYTAVCKIRNNNSVSKNTVLPLIGKIIKEMNPKHELCHDEPDLVIIVEVVQKACCFSVVKDYFKFRKYNLHEIVKTETEEENGGDDGNGDNDKNDGEDDEGENVDSKNKKGDDENVKDNEKADIVDINDDDDNDDDDDSSDEEDGDDEKS